MQETASKGSKTRTVNKPIFTRSSNARTRVGMKGDKRLLPPLMFASAFFLLCVYGFFLQPPRKDPFSTAVPFTLYWWLYPESEKTFSEAQYVTVGARSAFISRESYALLQRALDGYKEKAGELTVIDALDFTTKDLPSRHWVLAIVSGNREQTKISRGLFVLTVDANKVVEGRLEEIGEPCVRLVNITDDEHGINGPNCTTNITVSLDSNNRIALSERSYRLFTWPIVTRTTTDSIYQLTSFYRPADGEGPVAANTRSVPARAATAFSYLPVIKGGNWKPKFEIEFRKKTDSAMQGGIALYTDSVVNDFDIAQSNDFGVAVGNDGFIERFIPSRSEVNSNISSDLYKGTISSVKILPNDEVWVSSPPDREGNRTIFLSKDKGATWIFLEARSSAAPWVLIIALPLFIVSFFSLLRSFLVDYYARRTAKLSYEHIADTISNDQPIGLDDFDGLNFGEIARGIELFIRNINTEPPLAIAISGGWGSGKSSLMNLIKELLERDGARPVWFNAWHHEKEESLLAALLENVRQQAIPSFWTYDGLSFYARLLLRRLGREQQWFITFIVFTVTSCSVLYLVDIRLVHDIPFFHYWDSLRNLYTLPVATMPLWIALIVLVLKARRLFKVFPDSTRSLAISLTQPKAGDVKEKLSFRYKFAQEFRETSDILRVTTNPGIVIFIDDLDRCRPENIMELLEAIAFLSTAGRCVVLLSMSKNIVYRAICYSHEDLFRNEWGLPLADMKAKDRAIQQEKRLNFSEEYLEKLINIEVTLPAITTRQSLSILENSHSLVKRPQFVSKFRAAIKWVGELAPTIAVASILGLSLFMLPNPSEQSSTTIEWIPDTTTQTTLDKQPTETAMPEVIPSSGNVSLNRKQAGDKIQNQSIVLAPGVFILSSVLVLIIGGFVVASAIQMNNPKIYDSYAFEEALALWAPVVRHIRPTPRYLKRFKNYVRYLAMRARSPGIDVSFKQLITNIFGLTTPYVTAGSASKITEANLVALAALRCVSVDLVAQKRRSVLEQVQRYIAGRNTGIDDEGLELLRTAFQQHILRFGSPDGDLDIFNEINGYS